VLRDAKVPMSPENGQTKDTATTWVIHFPMKSPEGAVTRNDLTAIKQCEIWLNNKLHWTEHNPSVTITYKPHEVLDVMKWVWDHRDVVGGMSFLPNFDAKYAQMPYEEITKEEYKKLFAEFPDIDFSRVCLYEESDLTNAAQELACMGANCDITLS
jgi:ribonucleoside-diphosphate reductase alpha chain